MVLDAPPERYAAALASMTELALEHRPATAVKLLRAEARIWTIRGAQPLARAALEHATAVAKSVDEEESGLAASLADLVSLHASLGSPAAEAHASALRERATREPRGPIGLRLAAISCFGRALVDHARGEVHAALDAVDETIGAAKQAGAHRNIAIALVYRGLCTHALGRPKEGTVALRESIALFDLLGDRLHTCAALAEVVLADAGAKGVDARRALSVARRAAAFGDDRTAAYLTIALLERPSEAIRDERARWLLARARSLLGRVEDEGLARRLSALAARWDEGLVPIATPSRLVVTRDGLRCRIDGLDIDLTRRRALPAILLSLVEARCARPGAYVSLREVFVAGWPGERAVPHAAAARVYMAVRALRTLGLRAVLTTRGGSYRLEPRTEVDWVGE